jgi:hypothetical protein
MRGPLGIGELRVVPENRERCGGPCVERSRWGRLQECFAGRRFDLREPLAEEKEDDG